ncbi:RNase H domain-containing protein [Trichonephila clavipes]|nr:RNase H domain-containing protein [Trichonephila clavipes]
MLGRRIAARQPPLTCLPELRRALLDEWCNIPQDQIDNLILSMPSVFHLNKLFVGCLFAVPYFICGLSAPAWKWLSKKGVS